MPSHTPARTWGIIQVRSELSAIPESWAPPITQFIHAEQAAGIMLMIGAALGLAWANSPWAATYESVWHYNLSLPFIQHSARHWVNDGLMVLFFLQVGLEIKREFILGELSTFSKAAMPVCSALGGMAVPIALYLLLNYNQRGIHAWGVPVATDIAFALGVLSLFGRRVPNTLKVFLLAFATVDDIGGVLIIAFAYTTQISWVALVVAAALTAAILLLRRLRITTTAMYGILGTLLWLAMLESGVHATIAGVTLGLLSPVRRYYDCQRYLGAAGRLMDEIRRSHQQADEDATEMYLGQMEEITRETERRGQRLERLLRPWVSYFVLPIFAIANAGVHLSWPDIAATFTGTVGLGILVGLLVGKFVGVLGTALLVERIGLGTLPDQVRWSQMVGTAILAGIGFTVAIFIAQLAFAQQEQALLNQAKIAILASSVVAALAGAATLWFVTGSRGSR